MPGINEFTRGFIELYIEGKTVEEVIHVVQKEVTYLKTGLRIINDLLENLKSRNFLPHKAKIVNKYFVNLGKNCIREHLFYSVKKEKGGCYYASSH